MAWLRPILLAAGAVFLGLLIWFERRRAHQSQEGEKPRARDRRTTPGIDWADTPVPISPAPPLMSMPPRLMEPDDEPQLEPAATLRAPEAVAPPEPPPLRVEWPAHEERHIATLRIVPARQDRIAGRVLRQGLAGCGFRHGQLDIFHLPADDGRVVLSAASLVRPGTFDPATMDLERYAGVNLFAVLPGPVATGQTLERLATIAEELAGRVAGLVQDESGAPFTGAARARWRERCLSALDAGGAPAEPAH
jgi:FtsZ-interacting cell division protein ZipA